MAIQLKTEAELQLVKKAYEKEGFDWNSIKDWVAENGWLYLEILPSFKAENFDTLNDGNTPIIRPKSLHGFEINNGWIKITPKLKLPKKNFWCLVILKTGRKTIAEYVYEMKQFCILRTGYKQIEQISHFMQFDNKNSPLF